MTLIIIGLLAHSCGHEYISPNVSDGLRLDLWASDSFAPDPIAQDINDEGNVYLTRTNRQKYSGFDIKGHQEWMTAFINMETGRHK